MSNKINNIKKILYSSLEEKRLGRALAQIALIASGANAERLSEIKENYERLLNFYFSYPSDDPNRDSVYKNLIKETYELIDDVCAEKKSKDMSYNPAFSAFWQENRITEELKNKAIGLLKTNPDTEEALGESQINNVCLSVAAITISCIEVFDAEKIILLIKFSNHEDKKVSIRAFVGLLLCLQIHKNRYSFYPNINNELNLLFNSDEKIELAQIIYKQLLRAKQTEKITKDIKENIIPLITKIAPKINDDLTINKDKDWDGETENIQQMLEESGVSKKMESFQELMMEGADTNFSSFQHLKDMAFFQNIENWFMPFYHESKDLDGLRNENPDILDMVDNIFFLCDSDKYSFCLNLVRIPSNARNTLSEQLKVTSDKKIDESSEKDISNLYIQDLYRFYKLYKGKDQLIDPFTDSFNIYKSPFFRFLNEENTYISELADFYFTKEQYEDALYAFQFSDETASVETLKKIGYCYQKLMDYRKAIENYEKCEIIEEGNLWVNKNIAYCYKKLSKYDSALKYYQIADSLSENNISIIYNLAVCYTELKEFEKGLNLFYKIDYLEAEATHSEKFYLYKGHCLWANGKKTEAIENYKKYPYDKLFEALMHSPVELSELETIYISDYVRYNK